VTTPGTLGFACRWDRSPAGTWSGTPWNLRAALREQVTVEDIAVGPPTAARAVLKAAYSRRVAGEWKSLWRHSPASNLVVERTLRRNAARSSADVVVQVQDLGTTPQPFMLVQDLSYHLLLEKAQGGSIPHFRTLNLRRVEQLRDRQAEVYAQAAHLLPMSRWLARDLIASGVPEEQITVVNPGVNAGVAPGTPVRERRTSRTRRLLLVGRDFDTKGGDSVVAAFALLREQLDADIELTVMGPARWPLPGPVPDGVDFRGTVPSPEVAAALDSHDLFVMPSRFEGFGIAFVEALVRGLPCIGRRACAMPEIIDEVSGGRLVDTEDPHELAELVLTTLGDDDLYAACAAAALERREHYTWSRAATQVAAAGETVRAR
jgi:glycosyltransferase involved in cell wall biosynthesis